MEWLCSTKALVNLEKARRDFGAALRNGDTEKALKLLEYMDPEEWDPELEHIALGIDKLKSRVKVLFALSVVVLVVILAYSVLSH